jgi:hypothetical protein
MPIPTAHDRSLAKIDDLHGCVLIKLRTLQHAGAAGHGVTGLRELLQTYVDQVMALARDDAK